MTSRSIENARAYCEAIGKDPDELVWGGVDNGDGRLVRACWPRYTFMIGADPSLAVGSTELSPKQIALLNAGSAGE